MRSDGAKIYVRLFEPSDAAALLELRKRNTGFLRPWEPRRPVEYTPEAQDAQLQHMIESAALDRSYHFGIFQLDDSLVGSITLSNVARGAWQNATVGYFIDESHNGKGFAAEAIRLVVLIAFSDIGLHRVQAGVMPRNPASMRALEKAGFRREGVSARYVQIDGVWEDHVMFAITQEDVVLNR
jgi:ribosomal-protein-alanine N-acetyltransferase